MQKLNYSTQQANQEYTRCKQALDQIVGEDREYCVRLPYLQQSAAILAGIPAPMPNSGLDSQDWAGASTQSIVSAVQNKANMGQLDGCVVLMHENYGTTAAAVEQLCPWLKQQGYAVCTFSEMCKFHNVDAKPHKVYNTCFD